MPETSSIPGLRDLWRLTTGDPRVCVALLDGPAVLDHPCLREANVRRLPTYWLDDTADVEDGAVEHATHVCSVLFSPHDSGVLGLAPGCRGLLVPIQPGGIIDTYNLVRALDAARDAGAHIIHVAFVQPTQSGTAESLLERAVRTCLDEGILVVSPAGNDRGECWTMPSAIPGVLAVGAMNDEGQPFQFSNYGGILQVQGVLAPGENILGADPNGGTWKKKGTSCAAPIVTGVAALLMSLQLRQGRKPSAAEVRQAILDTAIPCDPREVDEPERCLRGKLNIPGAMETILGSAPAHRTGTARCATVSVTPSGEAQSGDRALATLAPPVRPDTRTSAVATVRNLRVSGMPVETDDPVSPAKKRLIYALGTIGYDFGTESRRDTFQKLMPPVEVGGTTVPANPYDPRQMSDHLARNPSEARSLVWTLHQEQTPVYALKPVGPFGHQIYEMLRLLLAGQVDASGSGAFVERVSVPAERTERAIRLFSGQVVPIVKLRLPRGLYGWQIDHMIEDALAAAAPDLGGDEAARVRRALRGFLDRVYHDLKNPGDTSKDRALNFAATNAFQVAEAFAKTVAEGRQLKSIEVIKSPICRIHSDCWDVKLKFFDPEEGGRAKRVCRLTVDVSDLMPVTLGEVRTWMTRD
ncbi:MAG: PatA/PatG family cyanobactin maturation protease [Singulisphaera sp.]|nr:PatA/PatG family cyanobactin maturation protease [Singulisphaera sp.]